jgi:hypothetical protein
MRVLRRQRLLVRRDGGRLQFLQGHHVRAGGGHRAGGALRVGVVGVDVVRGHGEVAAGAGLVEEQAAEEVEPHAHRQNQRDQRRRRLADQGDHQQHRDQQAEPRQEGLGEAAEVADGVRDVRVGGHDRRQEQGDHGRDQAPAPDPPVAAPAADRPVEQAPNPVLPALGVRAAAVRLRHVRLLRHTVASLPAVHTVAPCDSAP